MAPDKLVALLVANGVVPSRLDGLIHDLGDDWAATINNNGLDSQVRELVSVYGDSALSVIEAAVGPLKNPL